MLRLTFATLLLLALLASAPRRTDAQGDTKTTVRDGGSILIRPDGLDAGKVWRAGRDEIRHTNSSGVLKGLSVMEAGVEKCPDATCGLDASKAWKISINYGGGTLILESLAANGKGLHLVHRNLPFDQWKPTANTDEREFGHGDGRRISAVKLSNGSSFCAGTGCQVTLTMSPR